MDYGLFIDNEDQPAASGRWFTRTGPVSGKVVSRGAAASAGDVARAVEAAHAAFAGWSQTGPGQRRDILNKAAELIAERTPKFIETGIAEIGATAAWLGFNCYFAAKILREAAAMTTMIKGEIIPSDRPGSLSMGYRQPVGVLVGMAPWNAPMILGVRCFAMPVACGNTVVMKASEKCPGLHRMLGDVMADAGLPPGVLNIISHDGDDAPEVVGALIEHPLTRRINFTGSTRVGRIIAQQAARQLKPCLLELGGKAPLVVLDDADIAGAVNAARFGAFMNQGQICMSTEKVVVDASVADEFAGKFAASVAEMTVGDPSQNVQIGACVDEAAVDHLRELIADAVEKGASVICGGAPDSGVIMAPTIVDHVTGEMRLYHEESFGPVTALIRARDTEDAIRIANDTPYGLASAVFGHDTRRAMDVARRIEAGICHINGPTVFDEAQMPFGGVGASGYGRFGGTASIAEFTELRWITIEDPQQPYPI
ncbi:MAG: aldehyde dehydrogenase [Paracoccus sp. (in: a-proteobacteria)]|nr:aldehyde dehydrogenase [Paracoccus sp. (in: a-proteobacteria)]